jgi:hypothetical protein
VTDVTSSSARLDASQENLMGSQKPNPPGQPKPTTPGKPASRQSPDSNAGKDKDRKDQDIEEGQDIPKTGRDPSEPIDQDVSDDSLANDDEEEDDAGEAGNIELPDDESRGDRLDRSRPVDNP